jgi:endo-1,4-beta-xylanase
MMMRRRVFGLIFVAIMAVVLVAGMPGCGKPVKIDITPPYLRDLAEQLNFYIGTAVGYGSQTFPNNSQYMRTLKREFNAVVAEYTMKWGTIRPDRETFNYRPGDELLDFAENNKMMVRGHTLAWHQSVPAWVENGNFPRDEAISLLQDHINKVVGRWKGRIREWDVVNEVIRDDLTGQTGENPRRGNSVWERSIGADWVEIAFRAAAEADPDALLFYNDYGIERKSRKQDAVYALIQDLQGKGVKIDGVGFQGHFVCGNVPSEEELKASLDRFAGLGLRVQFTEVDIRIQKPVTADKLEKQAEECKRIIKVALEHPACDAVLFWGVDDGHSWINSWDKNYGAPLLFDSWYDRKPAYYEVRDYLLVEIERRQGGEEGEEGGEKE